MFIIRPIEQKDLDGLMELLKDSGHGLTSLPRDPEVLRKRIRHSERSFAHREDGPRGEDYLFAMEELFTGRIVGVCAIISKIGGFEPYYFYRLEEELRESKMIHIKNKIATLHFTYIHNGQQKSALFTCTQSLEILKMEDFFLFRVFSLSQKTESILKMK